MAGSDPAKARKEALGGRNGAPKSSTGLIELVQAGVIARGRWDAARVPNDRLNNNGGDLVGVSVEGRFDGWDVVKGQGQRQCCNFLRHTSRPRNSKGSHARSSLYQQTVRVPVVATFKLHDDFAASGGTGQPYGRHGGFSAGADETKLLDGRVAGGNALRQVGLCGR